MRTAAYPLLSTTELAKLERFLRAHTERFVLALVRIPETAERHQLAGWLADFAEREQRSFLRVALQGLTPLQVWTQLAVPNLPSTVIMLDGLDSGLHESHGEMASLLNRQRERIAELLPGPVLLTLADSAFNRFLADAPDLADWYAASFEFAAGAVRGSTRESTIERIESSTAQFSRGYVELRTLLLEQQRSFIKQPVREASVLDELGDLYIDGGDLPKALAAYRKALEISERLVESDPSNLVRQRDLSVSQEKIGDVLSAQGDLGGALAAYRQSLEVRRRLAESDSSNLGWQRDLSYSFTKMAQVSEMQGNRPEALRWAEQALAIDERLAAFDKTNVMWQKDVKTIRAMVERLR